MAEYIKKVVMLGEPAVGKTSLVKRFVYDMFDDKYISTLGAKPTKKVVKLEDDKLIMMIWDIAGHSLIPLHPGYYAGAKGSIIVCDLTRKKTLDSLNWWYSQLKKEAEDIPVKVLANKCDLDDWEFDLDDIGLDEMPPSLTSAKTGENVEEAFISLAKRMLYGEE